MSDGLGEEESSGIERSILIVDPGEEVWSRVEGRSSRVRRELVGRDEFEEQEKESSHFHDAYSRKKEKQASPLMMGEMTQYPRAVARKKESWKEDASVSSRERSRGERDRLTDDCQKRSVRENGTP